MVDKAQKPFQLLDLSHTKRHLAMHNKTITFYGRIQNDS